MSRATKGHQLLSACRRLSNTKYLENDGLIKQSEVQQCRSASGTVDLIRRSRPSLDQSVLINLEESAKSFTAPTKKTKISTLENGMKVATENSYGQFVSVGLFARVGSRYDGGFTPGISHVLEKLAFQGSRKYPTRSHIMDDIDQFGGLIDCQFQREVGMYTLSVLSNGLEKALEILADTILYPQLADEDIEAARLAVQFHLEDLDMQSNQDLRLTDVIHQAAYGGSGLGQPRLCPDSNIREIGREELARYLKAKMLPQNITLAAVNVDHDEFQQLAKKYFTFEDPSWKRFASDSSTQVDEIPVRYTPSFVKDERKMERAVVHANQLPDVAHYAIAYKSCSYKDANFVPTCVLNTMMGGGSSFSAGGPGKGLHSRLYMNVLSQHYFVMNAIATNHPYADTGLFVFSGSCAPSNLGRLAKVLSTEVGRLAKDVALDVEVQRAKQQLLSLLFMNLESRIINLEDIGRQVLELELRENGEQLREKILSVTAKDVTRVSRTLFESPPSFAALGDVSALPSHEKLLEIAATSTKRSFSTFNIV